MKRGHEHPEDEDRADHSNWAAFFGNLLRTAADFIENEDVQCAEETQARTR
jgi:hypothetical protein